MSQNSCNILSVSKLTSDHNCMAKFFASNCEFQDLSLGKMIRKVRECDDIYYLEDSIIVNGQGQVASTGLGSLSCDNEIMLSHYRLGHPSFSHMKSLFPTLFNYKNVSHLQCETCQLAKHHLSPYPTRPYIASRPFSLIHNVISGPSHVPNLTNTKWFISFIDDHTPICWVYLLKEKIKDAQTFIQFHPLVKNQLQAQIQILQTDTGTKYFNFVLGNYLSTQGIAHHNSCTNTPQQNGVAKCKNRHLLEVVKALMFTTHMTKKFWGKAFRTTTFLINQMSSRVVNFNTPLSTLLTT